MRKSDVLILMHGQGEICQLYLPSKIYEYHKAQRPVLLFSPVPNHWDDILDSGNHYIIDQSDPIDIDETLKRLIADWQRSCPIGLYHRRIQLSRPLPRLLKNNEDNCGKILTIEEYPFEDGEWAFYSRNIRKKYGWKGWYKQFWRHVRRPWSRSQICEFAPQGVGLEVGCGEWTIAPVRRTILSDAFEEHVGNKSLAKVFSR